MKKSEIAALEIVVCAAGAAIVGVAALGVAPGILIGGGVGIGLALLGSSQGADDSELLARREIADAYISTNRTSIEARRDERKEEFIQWVASQFELLDKDARAIVENCDSLRKKWDSEDDRLISQERRGEISGYEYSAKRLKLDEQYVSDYNLPVKNPILIMTSSASHFAIDGSRKVWIENGWLVWKWNNSK